MMSSLLFVSPVLPAETGNGLAMRAGTMVRVLAEMHRVSLLVASRYPPFGGNVPAPIAERCREIVVLPLGLHSPDASAPARSPLSRLGRALRRLPGRPATDPARSAFQDTPFEIVHVFRLAALPFARP